MARKASTGREPIDRQDVGVDEVTSGLTIREIAGSRKYVADVVVRSSDERHEVVLGDVDKTTLTDARIMAAALARSQENPPPEETLPVWRRFAERDSKNPVGHLIEQYLASAQPAEKTREIAYLMRTELAPQFAGVSLDGVNASDIHKSIDSVADRIRENVRSALVVAANSFFNWGIENGYFPQNIGKIASLDNYSNGLNAADLPLDEQLSYLTTSAIKSFIEHGYSVSLDLVAKEAGVTKRTLYNHFASKEDIFSAAILRAAREQVSTMLSVDFDAPLEILLHNLAISYVDFTLSLEAIGLFTLMLEEARSFPDLSRQVYMSSIGLVERMLAQRLDSEMDRGAMPRRDAAMLAERFFSSIQGHSRLQAMLNLSIDEERHKRFVHDTVEDFIFSLRRPQK